MEGDKNISEALASKLSNPKTIEALGYLVDRVTELHATGVLDSFMQTIQAITFLKDSVTDPMVTKNASIIGELYNIANEAAEPAMAEAVRELKNLQESGNLKTLAEASYTLAFMYNSVTDSMVQRIASFLAAFVEEVSTPHAQDILRSLTKCLSKTIQQFATQPPQPGIRNLVSVMRDPEVQMGLMFMAALAKNMQQCMVETYSGTS